MNHLVNWIEIPVIDMGRAIAFYSQILGYPLSNLKIGTVTYAIFPSEDHFNNGALVQGENYKPSIDGVTIYLDGGEDLNHLLSKVPLAGGKVIMKKMFLSKDAGYIGMFIDTEGNKIGVQNFDYRASL